MVSVLDLSHEATVDHASDVNRIYCFRILARFAEEVASRIRQYKVLGGG